MKIVPRPRPTAAIMKAMPKVMPAICGRVRRKPCVSPEDSSMTLFGPGVKNITAANRTKAIRSGCDMGHSGDLRRLALLAVFRFPQKKSAVQRGGIIGRGQRESDVGQHALDHPAEGRIFVAHVGDDAVACKPVVLDVEIRPRIDVALGPFRFVDDQSLAKEK